MENQNTRRANNPNNQKSPTKKQVPPNRPASSRPAPKPASKPMSKPAPSKAVVTSGNANNQNSSARPANKGLNSSIIRAKLGKIAKIEKLPKTVQDSIPIHGFAENGVFETYPGTFTKTYKIKDVNFHTATGSEQADIYQDYITFMNSLDSNLSWEITIFNHEIDKRQTMADVKMPEQKDGLNKYRREMNEIIKRGLENGNNSVLQDKYLTIALKDINADHAFTRLNKLDVQVSDGLKKITKVETRPLTTIERLELLYNIYNIDSDYRFSTRIFDKKEVFKLEDIARMGLHIKDVIAPISFNFSKDNSFKMGDIYAQAFCLRKVAQRMSTYFITDLSEIPGNMLISISVDNIAREKATRMVETHLNDVRADANKYTRQAAQNGYIPELPYKLKNARDDAEVTMNDISRNDQKLYFMTMTVVIFARTQEMLDDLKRQVITTAKGYSCNLEPMNYQQEFCFNTALPLCRNDIFAEQIRSSEEMGIFIPFNVEELKQKDAIMYGNNQQTKSLILYDRLKGANFNGLIFGGSGCVDRETEYFNGKEWKSIADYTEGEEVLQYNPKTDEVSLVAPEQYIKAPCDKMYHFRAEGIDEVLSPEHRVLYRSAPCLTKYDVNMNEITAQELYQKIKEDGEFDGYIQTGFLYGGKGINLDEIDIKIMLAVMCDGKFKESAEKNVCTLSLKDLHKTEELKKLLYAAGIPFKEEFKGKYTIFSFISPYRESELKDCWYQCSGFQLQAVCDFMLKWNGYATDEMELTTANKDMADFIQFAFSSCGYRAAIVNDDENGEIKASINIRISSNIFAGFAKNGSGQPTATVEEVTPRDGYKYCFTVPTHSLVLRRNGQIMVTGNSGKSFTAKIEMSSVLMKYPNVQVFVIDPQSEYTGFVEAFGGQRITLAPRANNLACINPLDLNISYDKDDDLDPVTAKSEFMISLFEIIGRREVLDTDIIDKCTRAIYKPYIEYLTENKLTIDKMRCPTLTDFYQKLMQMSNTRPEAELLAKDISQYTSGSFNTFASRTNIKADSKFVVYDTNGLGPGLKEMGLFICLNDVWNRMIENNRKGIYTWFYIDEFHLLLETARTASFLKRIWKMARKWRGVPTGITQNTGDILAIQEARDIVNNTFFVLMLNSSDEDRNNLQDLFKLSNTHIEKIRNADPGHGLLFNGKITVPFEFNFPKDTELYKIFNTQAER